MLFVYCCLLLYAAIVWCCMLLFAVFDCCLLLLAAGCYWLLFVIDGWLLMLMVQLINITKRALQSIVADADVDVDVVVVPRRQ